MITESLNIGHVVYELLKDIAPCYAIIADHGTEYPFIVYRRMSLYQQTNKDSNFVDNVGVEIAVASKEYGQSVELIQKIKDKLELKRTVIDKLIIQNTEFTGSSESWSEDAYIQTIGVNFQVTKR